MIQFNKTYRFTNDLGEFAVNAKTVEHPNDYGNGMLLCFAPVEHPSGVCAYDLCRSFDIRYERVESPDDIHRMVIGQLENDYGVTSVEVEG